MVAYQYRGEIYYRTYKPVTPEKELLVWYGESYAKDLGISSCDNQGRSISIGITNRVNKLSTKSFFYLISIFAYADILLQVMEQDIMLSVGKHSNRPFARKYQVVKLRTADNKIP